MKKLLILLGSVCTFASLNAANVVDVKVKILDGFGGDTGSVATRCQTKVGEEYDPVTVTRDVNALKDSGEFEEIDADAQRLADGVEVTFLIKRKVRYQAPLVVKGCDYFSESRVAKESELKDGYLYGEGDLAAAAAKVRLAYQKKYYLDAKVTPIVTPLESGNNATITFMVDEGTRQKFRSFIFEGAPHIVKGSWWNSAWWEPGEGEIDEKELREAIQDYPWWNPIGWFTDSPVTVEQQAQCSTKIAEIFRNHGYLDVKVALPERSPCEDAEDKVDVCFKIEEGARYRIGKMTIHGLTRYPEEAVRGKSELPEEGSVAGEKILADAAHRIQVAVGSGDSGLADSRVDVRCLPREDDESIVDVDFRVTEGVPVVIDDVVVRGNDYTMDKVIRREIALGPGDRMLADRAERSQKRLENLDYFSRVRYYLEPSGRGKNAAGEEYRNLVYEVEEKNTGSFMVGIGASSVDSVYLSAEVSQSNFDLFAPGKLFRGAGQKGRAFAQWGPRIQTFEASVTEPHLWDRLLEFTVEGYRRGRWYDDYDLYRTGAAATMSYPVKFWPTWEAFGRFGARYSIEYIEFDDTQWGKWLYDGKTVSLQDEENQYGDSWESVVRLFWSRDGRDNFRMPTSGGKSQIFFDISAGGDIKFWRAGLNHRHYFPIWKRFNHVLMAGIRAETIDALSDEIPIYDRMFLGGPRSIRGIKYRHVTKFATWAPSNSSSENFYHNYYNGSGYAMPWGGQTLFCMNFEYTIPIVKMLRLAVFTDLGSVGADPFELDFSDTFAWTAGIGIRLDIPMFPIRLDFATPIEKPDHADEEAFSFTVGYDF